MGTIPNKKVQTWTIFTLTYLNCFVCIFLYGWYTCIRGQVEVKDGDDGDEDAGEDDVQHVVQRLPLDDQVEGHLLILIIIPVLPARLVSDVPLAALWRDIHNLRISKMMAFMHII